MNFHDTLISTTWTIISAALQNRKSSQGNDWSGCFLQLQQNGKKSPRPKWNLDNAHPSSTRHLRKRRFPINETNAALNHKGKWPFVPIMPLPTIVADIYDTINTSSNNNLCAIRPDARTVCSPHV